MTTEAQAMTAKIDKGFLQIKKFPHSKRSK
jgi:hypothetical protein